MTTKEAIEKLDDMQRQIIHGSRTFGDIADVIRNLEAVRLAALKESAKAISAAEKELTDIESMCAAHRILANNNPDGQFLGASENLCSANDKLRHSLICYDTRKS